MSLMPRLTTPPWMPPEVEVVVEALGNRARVQILRELARGDALTIADLAPRVGTSAVSVLRHVHVLEEHGLVDGDHARGARRGRDVRWRARSGAVEAALETLREYLAGDDHSASPPG